MRSGHPALVDGTLSLDRFCALDHALVPYAGPAFAGATDAALAAIGRSRRVTVAVGCFLTVPKLLASSDLVAVVPGRLVEDAFGLTLVDPPLPVPGFTKTLAWHERTYFDPGRCWARSLMVQTSRTGRPGAKAEE